jgi:hypothetical protein
MLDCETLRGSHLNLERIAREVYGWTEADDARYWELGNKDWGDIQALTPEERSELEILEKRRPPRETSFAMHGT